MSDKVRYVELVRVSTARQAAKDTPELQRRALDALRQSRPGHLVQRIEEVRGVSGKLGLDDRPDLKTLASLSEQGAYDELRVYALDRLTRAEDPRERFALYGMVSDANAIIVDCTGHTIDPKDDIGEVDFYLQSLFASRERKKILARSAAGRMRVLAAGGYASGKLAYGLRYDKSRPDPWYWDPEESKVIHEIFRRVIAGESLKKIAKSFAARGMTTHRNGRWHASGIRYVISCPTYIGRFVHSGVTIQVPRLISDETVRQAEGALQRNKLRSGARMPKHAALLRGLTTCAECGGPIYVESHTSFRFRGQPNGPIVRQYACGNRVRQKVDHPNFRHSVEEMDQRFLEHIKALVLDPKALAHAIKANQDRTKEDDPAKTLAAARSRDDVLAKQEANILSMMERGVISPDTAAQRLSALKSQREDLRGQIALAERSTRVVAPKDLEAACKALTASAKRASKAEWANLVSLLFPKGLALGPGGLHGVGLVPLDLSPTASDYPRTTGRRECGLDFGFSLTVA